MLLAPLLLLACNNDHPDTLEGAAENDPRPQQQDVPDTTDGEDLDTGGTGEPTTPDTDPEPIGAVCYPGPALDWSVCVDVVDYRDAWGADYAYPEPYNGSPQYNAPIRYVDLSVADPDLALAPNFVLDEFMQEYKGRYGVFQPHVIETLQVIRDAIGAPLTVNSGYRNVTYNAGVGGATYSRHLYGDAVDIASGSATLQELSALCDDLGAGFVSEYTSHVHCDWRDDPLDEVFFEETASSSRSGPPVSARLELDGDRLWAPADGFDEGEPLRRWTAYTPDGAVCAEATGASFTPPPEAAWVSVSVGGQLWLEADL